MNMIRTTRAIVIGVLLLAAMTQVVHAALINWNSVNTYFGRPDKGNFGWYNINESFLRWNGRVYWSTANGRLGGLQQAENSSRTPTLEYEGHNPGAGTDCDNLNYYSVNSSLPRWWVWYGNEGNCPGNRSDIEEQVDIRIKGNSVQGDTTYDQYVVWSKTYLFDTNPAWKEVNLSYEEAGVGDLWLGKLAYDVQGSADGYVTNGRYAYKCASPAGAVSGLPGC